MSDRTAVIYAKRAFVVALAFVTILLSLPLDWSHNGGGTTLLAQVNTATPTPTLSLLPTPTPTPTFTPFGYISPLATPTPTTSTRIATEVTQPKAGDAIAGFTAIWGTAITSAYRRYEISIAVAGSDNWQWQSVSYNIIRNGQLYLLDTTKFADGFYDLRLRTIRDDGNYVDAIVRNLEIRNANPPTATPILNELGTPLPTATPTPQLTPATATPRPHILQNIPGGQGIFHPEIGEAVSGFMNVIGTASGANQNRFMRYELSISPAAVDNWTWLYSSTDQIWQNSLLILDTKQFADGYYDLRMRIVYADSNYDDFIVRYLRIANNEAGSVAGKQASGIIAPPPNSTCASIVDVIGSTIDVDFMRWELYWSPAGAESWAFLTAGERPALNGLLARLDLGKLGGASVDFRLRVVRRDYNYSEYFSRNIRVLAPPQSVLPTPFR